MSKMNFACRNYNVKVKHENGSKIKETNEHRDDAFDCMLTIVKLYDILIQNMLRGVEMVTFCLYVLNYKINNNNNNSIDIGRLG